MVDKRSLFYWCWYWQVSKRLQSNLNIGNTIRYNNNIFISNTDKKIGLSKDIKKAEIYHKKSTKFWLPVALPEAHVTNKMHFVKSIGKSKNAETILLIHNRKMFAEPQDNEKLAIALLIVGAVLTAFHILLGFNVFGSAWGIWAKYLLNWSRDRKMKNLRKKYIDNLASWRRMHIFS